MPEGLTRELPVADVYEKRIAIGSEEAEEDDLEDLKKQLEALNAAWVLMGDRIVVLAKTFFKEASNAIV